MRVLTITIAVAAVVLHGCGDRPSARARYVEAANGICAELERVLERIPAPQPGEPDAVERVLARTVEASRDAQRAIGTLDPPPELRTGHDRLTTVMREATTALGDALAAERANDPGARRIAADQLDRARAKFDALTASMGLDRCAPDPAPSESATGD